MWWEVRQASVRKEAVSPNIACRTWKRTFSVFLTKKFFSELVLVWLSFSFLDFPIFGLVFLEKRRALLVVIPHLALSLGSPNCHLGDMARGRLIREDGEIIAKFLRNTRRCGRFDLGFGTWTGASVSELSREVLLIWAVYPNQPPLVELFRVRGRASECSSVKASFVVVPWQFSWSR